MSHPQFFSLLNCFSPSLFQFLYDLVSYFPNSVPLISLMSCTPTVKFLIFCLSISLLLLFQFSLFFSLICEFPYRLSSLAIPFNIYNSPNPPSILVFFPFHFSTQLFSYFLSDRTTALRFQATCFSCFFLLVLSLSTLTPSHR